MLSLPEVVQAFSATLSKIDFRCQSSFDFWRLFKICLLKFKFQFRNSNIFSMIGGAPDFIVVYTKQSDNNTISCQWWKEVQQFQTKYFYYLFCNYSISFFPFLLIKNSCLSKEEDGERVRATSRLACCLKIGLSPSEQHSQSISMRWYWFVPFLLFFSFLIFVVCFFFFQKEPLQFGRRKKAKSVEETMEKLREA